MVSEVSRFRQMPLSSGSFRIKTGGDTMTISEINTQAEEFGMFKGGFTVSRSEDLTAQESLINEQLKADGRELKKPPYLFNGEVFVGVQPEKLENSKKVADRYFSKNEDGFSWASIHLSGEMDGLTIPLNEKIIEEMRLLRAEKE
jgi:hypothetical protein